MFSLCLAAMARQRDRKKGKGRAKEGGGQWHTVGVVLCVCGGQGGWYSTHNPLHS